MQLKQDITDILPEDWITLEDGGEIVAMPRAEAARTQPDKIAQAQYFGLFLRVSGIYNTVNGSTIHFRKGAAIVPNDSSNNGRAQ